MEIDLSSYFVKFVFLVLLIQTSAADCSLASNSLSREYTISSWTGNWTFEGYVSGPTTSDHYYLLSSAGDSQCGIIREDASGQKVWAKTYSNGQCSGLSISGDEATLYFSSAYTNYYAIGIVNSTDGSLTNYQATSNVTVTGKINRQFYTIQSGLEFVFVSGISASGATTPVLAYYVFSNAIVLNPANSTSMDSLTHLLGFTALDSIHYLYAYVSSASNFEIFFRNGSSPGFDSTWYYNVTCTSTCPSSDYIKSDYEVANIHMAFNLPTEGKALVMVFAISNGNPIGSLKMTQSSEQLTLGSLYATNNSATWISMYSSSSSYSELISYDAFNNNYTVYRQTGYSYSIQFINSTANYALFALGMPKVISNVTNACLSNVGGLSVSTADSGIEDTTLFTLTSVGPTTYTFDRVPQPDNITITSTANDMDYSYTTVLSAGTDNQTIGSQTLKDDDDLSAGEIVGIIFLSIYVLVLIAVITFVALYLYRRKKKYNGLRKVRAETLGECQPEEDLYSQHPQDEIQNN